MPEGQFTGKRRQYVYTSDAGDKYVLTLDITLAEISPGLTVFDPDNPGGATAAPKRFQPRIVYWQGTAVGFVGKRKRIVCGAPSDPLYDANTRKAQTIDGAAGVTTGRRGEKFTF